MRKKAMRKNLLMSIQKSLGRYIAILAIIALGAGLFVGLLASKTDIVTTGQVFTDEQNMFDIRLLNTYGWTQKEVDALVDMDGISGAEGMVTLDVVGYLGATDADTVFQLHQIPKSINRVLLLGGRMPEKPTECLADGFYATDDILGKTFQISENNDEDTLDLVNHTTYTVVGYVSTPIFMDMTRGNTTLGNGSISSYVYLPEEAFNIDYFTEINVTISNEDKAYTASYNEAVELACDVLEPAFQLLADGRYDEIYSDAMDQYNEGLQEFNDGAAELEDAKQEADKELSDAYQELMDAEKEIEENEKKLNDAQKKINKGRAELKEGKAALKQSQADLNAAKEDAFAQFDSAEEELNNQKAQVEQTLKTIEDALKEIETKLPELNNGITQLEQGIAQIQPQLQQLDVAIAQADAKITEIQQMIDALLALGSYDVQNMETLKSALSQAEQAKHEYSALKETLTTQCTQLQQQLTTLQAAKDDVLVQQQLCQSQKQELLAALEQIEQLFVQLQTQRESAQTQFAQLQAQIDAGWKELNSAEATLNRSQSEIRKGKKELETGKQDLQDGWDSYYEGKSEAEAEIADAEGELEDARIELQDAKADIDALEPAELYMLDRNTNVGYLAVENNSNIVSGVSRVFPVFFLLVASLVCITTMTRMVEEERTQIGTLKALGYSNGAIISKYLIYAGSAAVIGCGLGVFVGSVVFPLIIWEGYNIILEMKPQLEIVFDIPLCMIVIAVYTIVILAVTWYCCRMSLREAPAELIRPKAPTAGKKIFLEYLPFWDKIGFLNKVMFRNIFRYKQRLLMMLIGIGGCTALLVTGFGMGDSIMDIVSYQYQEVTLYDIQAQFKEGQTQQQMDNLRLELEDSIDDLTFVHQSSVDVTFRDQTKSIYLINGDEGLPGFFDFHSGKRAVEMPEDGKALLSVGIAEAIGVKIGDVVTVRNADMEEIQVEISDIFDNNVYNYIILSGNTAANGWGEELDIQTAFVKVPQSIDPHEVGAKLTGNEAVLSVMICQDMADQVGSMLDGLNLIIVTIVVCAGLLAVIVLYNLTNINIKERIREISTIKVLGFRAGETAAYVFKENMLLTAIGAVLGLGLGKLLLDFVMSQIRIDIVWMQARVTGISLLWSILITILMAVLVDFLLYFRLERINMAESLKSVE